MTKPKFPYKNFLKSKKAYIECVKYWEDIIQEVLPRCLIVKYFNNTFINCVNFFDGNPIFNGRVFNTNKIIHIAQVEDNDGEITHWKKEWVEENESFTVLHIMLELNEETQKKALDLIQEFVLIK